MQAKQQPALAAEAPTVARLPGGKGSAGERPRFLPRSLEPFPPRDCPAALLGLSSIVAPARA